MIDLSELRENVLEAQRTADLGEGKRIDLSELREKLVAEKMANFQSAYYHALSAKEKSQLRQRFLEVTGVPLSEFVYIDRSEWIDLKWLNLSSEDIREIVFNYCNDIDLITPEVNELNELPLLHLQSLRILARHFYEMAKCEFFEKRNDADSCVVPKENTYPKMGYPISPLDLYQAESFRCDKEVEIWMWKKVFSEKPRIAEYWFCHNLIIKTFKSATLYSHDARYSNYWQLFFPTLIERIGKTLNESDDLIGEINVTL